MIVAAVTKSGMGTWDLGHEDSGTPGHGTRGCRTQGRRDVGTRGLGKRDLKTLGLGDVGRTGLKEVINKQNLIFSLNLLRIIFGALTLGFICWRVCQQTSS